MLVALRRELLIRVAGLILAVEVLAVVVLAATYRWDRARPERQAR